MRYDHGDASKAPAERAVADNISREQRIRCMSRNSNKTGPTTPELRLRSALWSAGLRYRLRYKLPGKPDLVFPGARVAVFVDGCFWHGCPVHCVRPKSNQSYWGYKLDCNIERDQRVVVELAQLGWQAERLWQHEIEESLPDVVERLVALVKPAPAK